MVRVDWNTLRRIFVVYLNIQNLGITPCESHESKFLYSHEQCSTCQKTYLSL